MSKPRQILVTAALIYANGPVHLGHLVEYIQADIWTRFQKMRGNQCLYLCADDTHGTPIMLSAKKLGVTPEQLISDVYKDHKQDFAEFHIEFDCFHSTHSDENKQLTEEFYTRMQAKGDIAVRAIMQAYDPKEQMFLPDRYVKGECPRCNAADQYGDNCEVCGATYSPLDLKNPISVISGVAPVAKESEHFFFQLPKYTEFLKNWIQAANIQDGVKNKLVEWFKDGLKDLDISRDAPYFGFKIPGTQDKYFYVWLDAPIGYLAVLKKYCAQHPEINFDEYWGKDSQAELYHFIGKDIVNFHAIFWPAILTAADHRTPNGIFVHGYLTINGNKMSKSRGTFITARQYLENFNPECLRYYFAAKLNGRVEDIDFNFTDFMQRVNSDLVGKVVNIASRCASFIHKYFDGKLIENISVENNNLINEFIARGQDIAENYEALDFGAAVRDIMKLADIANQYIDEKKPWSMIKEEGKQQEVHEVCTMGINLFCVLIVYLKPVLPETAKKVEEFLNIPAMTWESRKTILLNHTINPFVPLMQRITPEQIAVLSQVVEA